MARDADTWTTTQVGEIAHPMPASNDEWHEDVYMRLCPRCSAVVPDTDEAQGKHSDWHAVSGAGVDFSGAFGGVTS